MITININSVDYEVEKGLTIIQACDAVGIEIPRFCYHEKLAIAGNCRMCLVDVEGGPPKPVASCAMPVAEGMRIHTNNAKVKKAREGVMEFLLVNHPLDCPICDQGGECDLQDQSIKYGKGRKRFIEDKRAVGRKDFGPLIKAEMTRCIHCTRCVRFLADVAGSGELGTFFRGEKMEIDTFSGHNITSELSGNIIDLCPVGALTSKPYAFKARPWDLTHQQSVDVMDAVGSAIRVDARGDEVMRILPCANEEINEDWISDKARFSYDGLLKDRIDRPYVRPEKGKRLVESTWEEALSKVVGAISKASPERMGCIAGNLSDLESMFLLKEIFGHLGSNMLDCRQDRACFDPKNRMSYLFNTGIKGVEEADLCLLVACNPRLEAPIISARMRKPYLKGDMEVSLVGPEGTQLNLQYQNLGNDPEVLRQIADGEHEFCKKLSKSNRPMIILGQDALTRQDGRGVLSMCYRIAEKFSLIKDGWNGFNVLQRSASRVGGLDLGFFCHDFGRDLDFLYLHGADEVELDIKSKFTVYQGHHGGPAAASADVILPGAAYTEKDATYVNTEGRYQRGYRAVFPPGEAKEDWVPLLELAKRLGLEIGVEDYPGLRHFIENKLGRTIEGLSDSGSSALSADRDAERDVDFALKFEISEKSFYTGNSICRASATMQKCREEFESG